MGCTGLRSVPTTRAEGKLFARKSQKMLRLNE